MNKTVVFVEKYNPFQTGKEYFCTGYGYDYAKIKYRGTIYHVPLNFMKEVNDEEVEFEDVE